MFKKMLIGLAIVSILTGCSSSGATTATSETPTGTGETTATAASDQPSSSTSGTDATLNADGDLSCSVSFTAKDQTILDSYTVDFSDGETVMDVTKQATEANNIEIASEGSGADEYVTYIGGIANGDDGPTSGWTYDINGESATVGAGSYNVQDGDSIEWTYVTSFE